MRETSPDRVAFSATVLVAWASTLGAMVHSEVSHRDGTVRWSVWPEADQARGDLDMKF